MFLVEVYTMSITGELFCKKTIWGSATAFEFFNVTNLVAIKINGLVTLIGTDPGVIG